MNCLLKKICVAVNLLFSFSAVAQDSLEIRSLSPAVMRQGDHFEFAVALVNHSATEITGQVQLLLTDAINNESVDGWFQNVFPNQFFTIASKDTGICKFPLEIPFQFSNAMHWQFVAATENYKQEKTGLIPVMSNQFFRSESSRFTLHPLSTDIFIKSLQTSDKTPNLMQRSVSLEVMSTRLWEACKQIALMSEVQNRPLDYFEKWAALTYAKFMIHLFPASAALPHGTRQDAADMKHHNTIAELSPWVFSTARPVNDYAQLFNEAANATALDNSYAFFLFAQQEDGSFPWFMGGSGDETATRYISNTLQKMLTGGIIAPGDISGIKSIKSRADKWLGKIKQPVKIIYLNKQHDNLFAILRSAGKKTTPLPPVRWKSGTMQLNLNDTARIGYAFQSVTGTLVGPSLGRSTILTKDTARSLTALALHSYFTDLLPGRANQHLKLTKTIFIRNGGKNVAADANTTFHKGDKLRIVLSVTASHPIYCLQLNDANPSAFYQKTPGMFVQRKNMKFYERQSPAGRKYFFPLLPAGKHEFVYETTVTQSGSFSEGITTAESLVSPGIINFIKGFPVRIE